VIKYQIHAFQTQNILSLWADKLSLGANFLESLSASTQQPNLNEIVFPFLSKEKDSKLTASLKI